VLPVRRGLSLSCHAEGGFTPRSSEFSVPQSQESKAGGFDSFSKSSQTDTGNQAGTTLPVSLLWQRQRCRSARTASAECDGKAAAGHHRPLRNPHSQSLGWAQLLLTGLPACCRPRLCPPGTHAMLTSPETCRDRAPNA